MDTKQLLIDSILPRPKKFTLGFIQDIILVSAFTLLTALCAKIKIEIGPIPITGQTFTVLLSGFLLGSVRGSISQMFYLVLGLTGLPLFARGGGIQYLLSPTFGYIIGFIFAAFFVGKLAEMGWDKNLKTSILAMIIGNILIYVFGLIGLARSAPLKDILKIGFYPFLIGDIIKILIASLVLPTSWRLIKKLKGQSIE